jgi:hypothetical protein
MPRFETKDGRWFWEIEVVDTTLSQCDGKSDDAKSPKVKTRTFETNDEASYAAAKLATKKRRHSYRLVGPSRHLGGGDGMPPPPPASAIALEQFFVDGDVQFLSELLRSTHAGKIAALAPRWYADTRPWARAALLAYIDDGCDRPLHKGLVKRLFKLAEGAGDDEAMAHFMVAFDRLSHRFLIKLTTHYWDRGQRQTITNVKMQLAQDPSIPARLLRKDKKAPAEDPQFSKATRRYLQRRAYRYFRKLGHTDAARYAKGVRVALALYTDESVSTVARLLDSWGLLHVLYARSPVLVRAPHGIRLADGKGLGDLVPAPHFPAAWTGAFAELLALATAPARTVRAWAVGMLKAHYIGELASLTFADVKRLVTSPHDEPLVLGAELLTKLGGLETLPLSEWLELLAIQNLDVLPGITLLAERLLSPARLGLAQCIELALGKTAPVAVLGLQWAKTKPIAKPDDLKAIARLARAGVARVRDEGTKWAVGVIAAHPLTTAEHVRDLCDGPFADARGHALAVVRDHEKFAAQPSLWFALTESPYADVRAFVLANTRRWHAQAPPETLRRTWTTAILSIYGGSAAKARVPRQIADRIAAHPDEARELLPVLGYALRSVRPAERALALGSLARAARGNAGLAELAHQALPELTISGQVSS